MTSRHLVDPELAALLDALPTVTFSAEILPTLRAGAMPTYPCPPTPGTAEVRVTVEHAKVTDGAPDVEFRVYRPQNQKANAGCVVHMHGGGFLRGSALAGEVQHRYYATALGCVVVSVDYRLAPETHFPGNIEDCYAALGWVFAHAAELGIDTAKIGVAGESAGGGLAACLALLARDRGEYQLAFQHLTYPMLDDRTCTEDAPHAYTGEFLWNRGSNHYGWASLLGMAPGSTGVSPYAAAARATDLTRLPPTFIVSGTLDLFLEENLDYARRLTRAGVPVELHVYPGAVHAFDFHPTAAISVAAREVRFEAFKRFLK